VIAGLLGYENRVEASRMETRRDSEHCMKMPNTVEQIGPRRI
jgi:hypothetical protein